MNRRASPAVNTDRATQHMFAHLKAMRFNRSDLAEQVLLEWKPSVVKHLVGPNGPMRVSDDKKKAMVVDDAALWKVVMRAKCRASPAFTSKLMASITDRGQNI